MNKPEKIAAIVAITQIFKQYGVPTNMCPTVAILLGAAIEYSENPTTQGIIDGIVLGAISTGGYGVVKGSAQSVMEPIKNKAGGTLPVAEHDDYRGV